MTTPNYDDILNALDRQAKELEFFSSRDPVHLGYDPEIPAEDARLLREAANIVREHRKVNPADPPNWGKPHF